jgi:hypothetical protein
MKKLLVIILLVLGFSLYAGGTTEELNSFGVQYSNSVESQSVSGVNFTTTLNSLGGFFRNSTFYNGNENQGIFIIDSFLIPLGGTIASSGITANYSLSGSDLQFHLGMLLGPVYRTKFNDETSLLVGFGPSFQELAVANSSSASISFLLGAGADLCLQNKISDYSFLNVGVTLAYDIVAYSKTNNYEGWTTGDYSNISIRPYLGIGFSRTRGTK